MTDVSEQMFPVICTYCANCIIDENGKKKCRADVPWYCASINCKYFAEPSLNAEKIQSGNRKRKISMKRLMKKVLVETF